MSDNHVESVDHTAELYHHHLPQKPCFEHRLRASIATLLIALLAAEFLGVYWAKLAGDLVRRKKGGSGEVFLFLRQPMWGLHVWNIALPQKQTLIASRLECNYMYNY
jgi:hypothetical protein